MLDKIVLLENFNYIGVFLTLRCNLGCDYCINRFGEVKQYDEMSGDDWIRGLTRIVTREDLPITLQGGEPTLHPDFYPIMVELGEKAYVDLLTNGLFDINEFTKYIQNYHFKRQAKYASIRFSFHQDTNLMGLAMKVMSLQEKGYLVGIWGLDHPNMYFANKEMKDLCRWLNIDFRIKNYLDRETGNYKYPDAISSKVYKNVICYPSEILIAPDGYIFRCHADLYAGINPVAHILDENVFIPTSRTCSRYGLCNPCDVKIKTNRFQEDGHTSVKIEEIR